MPEATLDTLISTRDCGHSGPVPGLASSPWLVYTTAPSETLREGQEFARVDLWTGRVVLRFSDAIDPRNVARNAVVCLRTLYERNQLGSDPETLAALRVVLAALDARIDPASVL